MSMPIDFSKDLNPEQLRVVREGDGPCLVLAGAGSGKTRTITYRVAYLLSQGVAPDAILLLTFTNKAANEMTTRIAALLKSQGKEIKGLWSGTFHAIAHRILRFNAERLGYRQNFSILDEEDSRSMVKHCIRDAGIDPKVRRFPSPAVIHGLISFSRNARMPLAEALDLKYPRFLPLEEAIDDIAKRYTEKKRLANAMDFDDLLENLLLLLKNHALVREALSKRFQYILVDEYQDTNPVQGEIVDLLASHHQNILAVGDDAQSIYSFRAASIANILEFPQRYKNAKTFKLETNYRSTPEILSLANNIIKNNKAQFKKKLRSVRASHTLPTLAPQPSSSSEAGFVADKILAERAAGVPFRDMAVLFRAAHHSQNLEMELMSRDVPYEYRGGTKFFERAHIKDALAFLRVYANPRDEVSWVRILGLQTGIGDAVAAKIAAAVRSHLGDSGRGAQDWEILIAKVEKVLPVRAQAGWHDLSRIFRSLVVLPKFYPAAMIREVCHSSYADYLEAEYPNARDRLLDLEQLAKFAEREHDAVKFLGELSLTDGVMARRDLGDRDESDRLVLSTIHQAKGLEWHTVFLIRLTDNDFPNRKAIIEASGLEEERRLFYVAATRAKRALYLTYPITSGYDMVEVHTPSRFLEELDEDVIKREDESGYDTDEASEETVELDGKGERKIRYLRSDL